MFSTLGYNYTDFIISFGFNQRNIELPYLVDSGENTIDDPVLLVDVG